MRDYQMWIDGKYVNAASGKTFTVLNPATEEEIARVPLGDKADIDKAVEAAKNAFPSWSQMPQAERTRILLKLSDILAEIAGELGKAEMLNHGFPQKAAMGWGWFPGFIIRDFAEMAKSISGEMAPRRSSALLMMQYEPLGVCGLISPWNFPLLTALCKLAPCIATGNTCVMKPPSVACLPVLTLAEAFAKSDMPPGVVNIVTGSGSVAGEALAAHPDVRMVSFTGSSETGKRIMSLASRNVKRMNMELGGKNPFIVLEDADIDLAAESGVHGSYWNVGQVCGSPGKYYIHEKVYDKFVSKFVERASKIKVGTPESPDTQMGPLQSMEQRNIVESYIKSGIEEGAKVEFGGRRPDVFKKGYYLMPTVMTEVTQNMKISREEIFGPVAVMLKFSTKDDIVSLANDNVYGLAASVWSKDTSKAIKIANELQAGTVWVNTYLSGEPGSPWGGFKESGFGKEGTRFGLREYVQMKTICVDLIQAKNNPANELP
jgi:acyl-CoA reductase-like NAD-dependent aldehyde dehydrogenase